jgi:DNA-binding NarL/FixJ family response regulator
VEITVLLADDHAVVRDGLNMFFSAQPDVTVIAQAADGLEAVRLASEQCPDVAIFDIAMPKLDGIEATRRVREVCPNVQVIILSMHSTTEHIYQALQAGACGYLLKITTGDEVIEAVRAVHRGQRYLSRHISHDILETYARQQQIDQRQSPLESLSPRERQILQFLVEGHSAADIGRSLDISPKTVETYRSRMMQKLGIDNIPNLVKFAIHHGIIAIE